MVRSLFIISVIISLGVACSSTKPLGANPAGSDQVEGKTPVRFVNNISVTPGSNYDGTSHTSSSVKNKENNRKVSDRSTIENYSALQFKYAILTNSSVETMRNEKLLWFMEEWYGVPYHYGGTTKDGIDCSAFASLLMSSVYDIDNLPRMSGDQYIGSTRINREELREGDLVFFHTLPKKKSVTHVGVYLCNNKFVHASLSGVMISDMGEGYYAQHYVGAGRVRENNQ